MASHHFIGVGSLSGELRRAASAPEALAERIADLVSEARLEVVSRHAAAFAGGGLTLVWILAESHLVLHVWEAEGFATLDLHVCDYHVDNRARAERLVQSLEDLCFAAGTARWRSLTVETPAALPVAG